KDARQPGRGDDDERHSDQRGGKIPARAVVFQRIFEFCPDPEAAVGLALRMTFSHSAKKRRKAVMRSVRMKKPSVMLPTGSARGTMDAGVTVVTGVTLTDQPAILGGVPIRPQGPPDWPPSDPDVERAIADALSDGSWGRYDGGHVARLEADLCAY